MSIKAKARKTIIVTLLLLILSAAFAYATQFMPKGYFIYGLFSLAFVYSVILYWVISKLNGGTGTDEETQKQIELLQEQVKSQDRLAEIGVLTAGIAHEIKNPLNFINNFSNLTIDLLNELKEAVHEESIDKDNVCDIIKDMQMNCQKIHQHGKRAEVTVMNMLAQSRPDQHISKQETDLNLLLDEYLNLAYHGMRAQNPNFNVSFKKDYGNIPPVNVEPQSIGRVFLNIINNGMYAANEKKNTAASPTISVKTVPKEDHVIIYIKDNGPGIPEKMQKEIFEAFYTTKPPGQGTGLGLQICYEIIKKHGGDIKVSSKENEYTEFKITLPLKQSRS